MNDADDYLGKMPFFIVFLDPLHTDFHSSGKPLNEYIARHPLTHDKLHRPAFTAKILDSTNTPIKSPERTGKKFFFFMKPLASSVKIVSFILLL